MLNSYGHIGEEKNTSYQDKKMMEMVVPEKRRGTRPRRRWDDMNKYGMTTIC